MRTLVVSDLHLGATKRTDLLRRAELREPLLEALEDVDRLVILGDGIELRDTPQREALASAGAFLEDVGRALGPERRARARRPATTTTASSRAGSTGGC